MAIRDVFQSAVKAELAKSNGTKWGNDESVNVILALFCDNVGEDSMAQDAEFVAAIKKVVNPSAFAQSLESTKIDGKAMLTRQSRGAKTKSALMDFGE